MRNWINWVCIFSLFAVTACGFHLRGVGGTLRPLPFSSVYLDGDAVVLGNLRTALTRDGRAAVTDNVNQADAVLRVYGEQAKKDILTINSSGNINEYQLTYRVEVQLQEKGVSVGEPIVVVVNRTLGYSDSAILGKQDEENMLWNDMRDEAAQQILRRVAYLKPVPVVENAKLTP